MATSLTDLNDRLEELKGRQNRLNEQPTTTNPVDAIQNITASVATAADAANAAYSASINAASAAASAAGHASAASRAEDAADASAQSANEAASTASSAATNALSYKEATYSTYYSVEEMYSGVVDLEQKADATLAAAQALVYKTEVLGITDGVADIRDPKSHTTYYSITPATSVAISWPNTFAACAADVQYITNFIFTTAADMGESTWSATDQIYWSGNDCEGGTFLPAGNVIYDIIVVGNGTKLRGYVSGTPVPTDTTTEQV